MCAFDFCHPLTFPSRAISRFTDVAFSNILNGLRLKLKFMLLSEETVMTLMIL